MTTHRRLLGLTAALAGAGAVAAGSATAPAHTARDAQAAKITRNGVGQVRLGARFRVLRDAGLVGPARPGCELEGPGTRFAELKAPLQGTVDLTRKAPRRVKRINVRGGAAARGVGVGDRLADIKARFPDAEVNTAPVSVFGVKLVRVPRRFEFVVRASNDRIRSISVRRVQFCD